MQFLASSKAVPPGTDEKKEVSREGGGGAVVAEAVAVNDVGQFGRRGDIMRRGSGWRGRWKYVQGRVFVKEEIKRWR